MDRFVVTTTDGRRYEYSSFEDACLAGRERFNNVGYTITDEKGEVEVTSERKV